MNLDAFDFKYCPPFLELLEGKEFCIISEQIRLLMCFQYFPPQKDIFYFPITFVVSALFWKGREQSWIQPEAL